MNLGVEVYEEQERRVSELCLLKLDQGLRELRADGVGPERLSLVLSGEAELYLRNANPVAAAQAAAEALRKDPESPLAWAVYLWVTERGSTRSEKLRSLAQRWPTLASPRRHLGQSLLREGLWQEARTSLEEALEKDPRNILSWFALAQACAALKDVQATRNATDSLLSIARDAPGLPFYTPLFLWRAHRYRAALSLARNRARAATKWRSKLLPWTLPLAAAPIRVRRLWTLLTIWAVVWVALGSLSHHYVPWWLYLVSAVLFVPLTLTDMALDIRAARRREQSIAASLSHIHRPTEPDYLRAGDPADMHLGQRRRGWNPRRVEAVAFIALVVLGTIVIAVETSKQTPQPPSNTATLVIRGTISASDGSCVGLVGAEAQISFGDSRDAIAQQLTHTLPVSTTADPEVSAPACRISFRASVPTRRVYSIDVGPRFTTGIVVFSGRGESYSDHYGDLTYTITVDTPNT